MDGNIKSNSPASGKVVRTNEPRKRDDAESDRHTGTAGVHATKSKPLSPFEHSSNTHPNDAKINPNGTLKFNDHGVVSWTTTN